MSIHNIQLVYLKYFDLIFRGSTANNTNIVISHKDTMAGNVVTP